MRNKFWISSFQMSLTRLPLSQLLLLIVCIYRKGDRDRNQHLCHKLWPGLWHWNGDELFFCYLYFKVEGAWTTCIDRSDWFCRNTLLTCSSAKAGRTSVFALRARWRCFPWTTCWPATSGLRTPSSSMGRNPLRTTWPRQTSYCVWKTTGLCCTPWGETVVSQDSTPVMAFKSTTISHVH